MKGFYRFFAPVLFPALLASAALAADKPAPSGDPFLGDYRGVYRATGRPDQDATGMVVSEGHGLYRILVRFEVPGSEGYHPQIELHGHAAGPRALFYGFSHAVFWNGEARDGRLTVNRGEGHYGGSYELTKYIAHSPTEGKTPPAGAVVLLAYEEGKAPDLSAWKNQEWEAREDGTMVVKPGTGANYTKQKFGDMLLHLEFKLPHMPAEHGQGRANSGIYIQNRYEVQILDSFGVIPGSGDCGGIYQVAAPRVNASYPPGQWQTYDITFRAPRLNEDGSVKEFARVTVVHNGITIHDDQVLEKETPGGVVDSHAEKDCFQLQDHGNRPAFRNIWVLEK
jgi:hypothetical protein